MKIKLFTLLIPALFYSLAFASSPSRYVDGKIEIAKAVINGTPAFTQEEIDKYLSISTAPISDVVTVIQSGIEGVLLGSSIKFNGLDDFKRCVDNKDYLDDKILDLLPSIAKKNKQDIDVIKAENAKR